MARPSLRVRARRGHVVLLRCTRFDCDQIHCDQILAMCWQLRLPNWQNRTTLARESVRIEYYLNVLTPYFPPLPGLVSSSSSRSCCNTVIILVVRCVHTAAFENGSSSLYRGAGDPQAIRVWRIDGRSHSWEPATGWVFVGQSFCQFHWSWLARLAGFFHAGRFFLLWRYPFLLFLWDRVRLSRPCHL